jgi:hypothetical protein
MKFEKCLGVTMSHTVNLRTYGKEKKERKERERRRKE